MNFLRLTKCLRASHWDTKDLDQLSGYTQSHQEWFASPFAANSEKLWVIEEKLPEQHWVNSVYFWVNTVSSSWSVNCIQLSTEWSL